MKANVESHPKFKKLKRRLRIPMWQVKGLLESIWNLTSQHMPDGAIGRYSNEDIAACIEWDDDADHLISMLVETGWIDECEENRLIVHGWEEHCPRYIKGNMHKHGKEFAKQVTKQSAKECANVNASDVATKPNLTLPNHTIEEANASCSELPSATREPAIYELPTNKNGEFYPFTQSDMNKYSHLYPAVNIDQELRKMIGWLDSNKQKRKTKRGMPAFINNWLSRQQDKGGSNPSVNNQSSSSMNGADEWLAQQVDYHATK